MKWAEIARANRDPQNGAPLAYVQLTEVIKFTEDELKEGAKLWEKTLMGMVVGTTPNYNEMLKFVRTNWKDCNKIHQVSRGVYLFDFSFEEAKNKVLHGKWAVFNCFPLILKPWRSGLNLNDCFDRVPVWIQLPGLSLDLWTTRNLSKIASYVGMPIMTDNFTAKRDRLGFARVMIEVHINDVLSSTIPLCGVDGNTYQQQVVYEWRSVKCGKCGWFGHLDANCQK